MTIKEIEMAAEMTRANIRFYESEGLISPVRSENGYRVYSEEDLRVLKKIKLLRSLQISLDEIKKLHSGEHALEETLAEHLSKLEQDKKGIEQSQKICKVMKDDGVSYQSLNAQHYLKYYEQTDCVWNKEMEKDILPVPYIPVRRFFARMLDYYLYSTLWYVFLTLVIKVNTSEMGILGNLLSIFVTVILVRVLEPFMLCLFGTTLGKWILGIRILNEDGNRLSYRDASERTGDVLWKGVGFYIPILDLVRMWKSYKSCEHGKLEWEYKSCISLKDNKGWRGLVYCGICLFIFVGTFIVMLTPHMPKHRGDITISQFQENYENLNGYYGVFADEWWKENPDEESSGLVVDVTESMMKPKVRFLEEDGMMKGLSMELEVQSDSEISVLTYEDEMILSMLAFIGAQEEHHILSSTWNEILDLSEIMPYEEYEFEKYGVKVQRVVECKGYAYIKGTKMMFPSEEEIGDHYYSLQFQIEKTE